MDENSECKKVIRSCVDCGVTNCNKMDKYYPDFCLTTGMDETLLGEVIRLYDDEENKKVTLAAAGVESDYYCQMCRVEETIEFAKRIGAKKIGIATCVGLIRETRTLSHILRSHGFEVYGVACKAGTVRKTEVGIPKTCENTGVNMCNPILQAKMLNAEQTDLNIVMGLCVGHDSMFYKYAEGLTTTLVVKDRVLGHNPVATLYAADGYYHNKLFPQD